MEQDSGESNESQHDVIEILQNISAEQGWKAILEIAKSKKHDDLLVRALRWEMAAILQHSQEGNMEEFFHPVETPKSPEPQSTYENVRYNSAAESWQALVKKSKGKTTLFGHFGTDLEAHLEANRLSGRKRGKKRKKSKKFMDLAELCQINVPQQFKPPRKKPKRSMPDRCKHRSKYIGVTHDRRSGGWLCRVKWDKKLHYVGYFGSELDAAIAHDVKARELYGPDRMHLIKINFPVGHANYVTEMPKKKTNRGPRGPRRMNHVSYTPYVKKEHFVKRELDLDLKQENEEYRNATVDSEIRRSGANRNYNTRSRIVGDGRNASPNSSENIEIVNILPLQEIANAEDSDNEDGYFDQPMPAKLELPKLEKDAAPYTVQI